MDVRFFLIASMLILAATSAIAAPGAAPAVPPASPAPAADETIGILCRASDARFTARESARNRQDDYEALKSLVAEHPDSYALHWRAARAAWFIGDRLEEGEDDERLKSLGLEAMGWAERAVELEPDGIEGRFYRALAISVYARGISIIKALMKGLGGNFEKDMEHVISKNAGWAGGAAQRALGRYWYTVPWPKRSLKKSERFLRESLVHDAGRFRTHLYLADTLARSGNEVEAEREYRFVLDSEPGPEDLNEIDTVRALARTGLRKLKPGGR